MMEAIFAWTDKHLSGPLAKFSEEKHIRAIRDGVVSSIPLIMIGSLFLIIGVFPYPDGAVKDFIMQHQTLIMLPYRMTMFIMTLYVVIGVGASLAKSYKYDPVTGSIIGLTAYLLTMVPVQMPEGTMIPDGFVNLLSHIPDMSGWVLRMSPFTSEGMFLGMLMAIFGVEVLHFCKHFKITIRMPAGVPSSVSRSFEAIIPIGIITVILFFVRYVFNFDLQNFIMTLFQPLVYASGTYAGMIVMVLLITILWSCGIHGVSIVGAVARPLWMQLLEANSNAALAGTAIPNIAPEPFYQWFVWIGGSGATIGLVIIMCLFAKSKYMKTMGRACLVPGIFNINEPVIYGAPIMLNPYLVIPFIIGPVVTSSLSYFVMKIGLVARPIAQVPWTLPAPIGAYLSTGGDWKAIILCLVNIVICMFIYLPFFKMYDNKLARDEQKAELEEIEKSADGEKLS